jgi:hypothetical protein
MYRRVKGVLYKVASSEIRLGAWEYMYWKHILPLKKEGTTVA